MSEIQSESESLLLAALGLGIDLWTSVQCAGLTMQEYNIKTRESPDWAQLVKIAEGTGRSIKGRIEQMRAVIVEHDEAVADIQKRAVEFRERQKRTYQQVNLL